MFWYLTTKPDMHSYDQAESDYYKHSTDGGYMTNWGWIGCYGRRFIIVIYGSMESNCKFIWDDKRRPQWFTVALTSTQSLQIILLTILIHTLYFLRFTSWWMILLVIIKQDKLNALVTFLSWFIILKTSTRFN